jgi:hypothetical protein
MAEVAKRLYTLMQFLNLQRDAGRPYTLFVMPCFYDSCLQFQRVFLFFCFCFNLYTLVNVFCQVLLLFMWTRIGWLVELALYICVLRCWL